MTTKTSTSFFSLLALEYFYMNKLAFLLVAFALVVVSFRYVSFEAARRICILNAKLDLSYESDGMCVCVSLCLYVFMWMMF